MSVHSECDYCGDSYKPQDGEHVCDPDMMKQVIDHLRDLLDISNDSLDLCAMVMCIHCVRAFHTTAEHDAAAEEGREIVEKVQTS